MMVKPETSRFALPELDTTNDTVVGWFTAWLPKLITISPTPAGAGGMRQHLEVPQASSQHSSPQIRTPDHLPGTFVFHGNGTLK